MSHVIFTPPIQRVLRSDAYDAIRQAVISGAIKPGERINEAEISRQMRISRAPIREAIRQLEQEGLLISMPHRGTFVVTLSRDDVEEIYSLRADIESRAVHRALPRFTAEHFRVLATLVSEMQAAAAAGNVSQLVESDTRFHRTIVEATGWSRLTKIWENLHPQTLTLYTLTTLTDWPPPVHAERHLPVLEALRGGDPDRAAAAIREHILGVGAQVIVRLPTVSPEGPSPTPAAN